MLCIQGPQPEIYELEYFLPFCVLAKGLVGYTQLKRNVFLPPLSRQESPKLVSGSLLAGQMELHCFKPREIILVCFCPKFKNQNHLKLTFNIFPLPLHLPSSSEQSKFSHLVCLWFKDQATDLFGPLSNQHGLAQPPLPCSSKYHNFRSATKGKGEAWLRKHRSSPVACVREGLFLNYSCSQSSTTKARAGTSISHFLGETDVS